MIDSGDSSKFNEGAKELEWVMKLKSIAGIPILVYANKQDLDTAVEPEEIEEIMNLNECKAGREYSIQPCVAIEGIGVAEGTKWLLEHVKPN